MWIDAKHTTPTPPPEPNENKSNEQRIKDVFLNCGIRARVVEKEDVPNHFTVTFETKYTTATSLNVFLSVEEGTEFANHFWIEMWDDDSFSLLTESNIWKAMFQQLEHKQCPRH